MARRKSNRKIIQKNRASSVILKIAGACFLLAVFSLSIFFYYTKDLPRPEVFTEKLFVLPTKIYDRQGEVLLYQIFEEEKRTIVSLNQVSDNLKNAVVAAEDSSFYHHFGLDLRGVFRAIFKNIQIGQPIFGGSTISQQLIRSSFLTLEKTAERKIKEVILTLELERRYSKDQILEFYLNQVPFGSNAYGVEAASQTYFTKPASEVSLAQAALLASLIRAPSYLSPYGENKEELLARKDYVLDRMTEEGYINSTEAEKAKEEILEFAEFRHIIKAPHFIIQVKNYLEANYSGYFLREKGLKVYTSLDWQLQERAEKVVKEGVERNKGFNSHNAALVAINPQTGEILAMVGSKDYFEEPYPENCTPGLDCQFEPNVNAAMYGGGRQPGSAFKPFAYAVAFQKDLTPDTVIWDVKTEFNPDCSPEADQEKDEFDLDCYHPKNYDDEFRGKITPRESLAQSINLPSVKVLYLAGVRETINLAKKMGITTLEQPSSWYGLSLVLGGGEVRLLDLVSAYSVFAAEGLKVSPVFIQKIEDSEGNIIETYKKTQKRVLDPQTARLINDILSDNEARAPMFGLYSPLYFPGYQVAAKTGTTQDYKDAWTVGYTPLVAAGVWAGNNDGSLPEEEPGLILAGVMWNQFMRKALEIYPSQGFTEPEPTKPIPTEEPLTHSVLHYLREEPDLDPQYQNWEWPIQSWLENQ